MASASGMLGRSGSRRDGERAVGAFARRQARRRWWMGLFGLSLAALATWIFLELRPTTPASVAGTYEVVLRCVDCGAESRRRIRASDTLPVTCPGCAGKSMHEMWRCLSCGARFVPAPDGRPARCPSCGDARVGSASEP